MMSVRPCFRESVSSRPRNWRCPRFLRRTWCEREFAKQGLAPRMVQASVSDNKKKGTLRGMHYQAYPSEETRLVRCARGATFDAVVDLRPHSPTFLRHLSLT